MKAVVAAMELVSNASAKITHLWREKVTTDLNKALLPVAKEATNFQSAPPSLFGTEFAKKAKDHVNQVKAMRGSLPTKPDTRLPFLGGPPRRGGGGKFREFRGSNNRQGGYQVPEGRSSEQLQALPQRVPEARTSQELMHQSHAISPPELPKN